MKRIAALIVRETIKFQAGYVAAVLSAWKSCGVEAYAVYPADAPACVQALKPSCESMEALRETAQRAKADEIIVMDDSLMGPVTDLTTMLKKLNQTKADVWYLARKTPMFGMKAAALQKDDVLQAVKNGSIEELQAACEKLHLRITELYDTSAMASLTETPMLDEPLTMAKVLGCPFFLHEVFHRDYEDVYQKTLGHQAQVFYRWLKFESGWDTGVMWDYLLYTYHMEDIFWNMHLTSVLPTHGCQEKAMREHIRTHGLALVMHLYYEEKLPESYEFASRFPEETHVYITTSSEEKRQTILKVFADHRFAHLDVRVVANRGRDVSALLVGVADVYSKYEYVCFFHDKKVLQTKPGSVGAGFAYRCTENLFATKDFVLNVVQQFAENERLGLLTPPAPHHADYFFTLGLDWGPNYELTRGLKEKLGLLGPISADKMPIAPLGTCFWFRSRALKPLMDYGWKYEDFPPEPNNADGTILHAIERIYPFVCVSAGYYPAYLMSDRYAGAEYSSMRYYVRGFNEACFHHGIMNYQREMRAELIRRIK